MFSFIIPAFNHVDFLRATLTSILWQAKDAELEVIIVDNNSNLENPDLLYQEFFGKLDIYLIKQPKLSHPFAVSKARNIALKLAKYPWIVSLDGDIVLNPSFIKALKGCIDRDKSSIIAGERIFIESANVSALPLEGPEWLKKQKQVISSANYDCPVDRRLEALKKIEELPHPWAYMHGCNCIFPREKALAIGGYDEAYDGNWGYEDIDFAFRLIIQQELHPKYCEGLFCYHLEPPSLNLEVSKRFDKKSNPNWIRITQTIPGFKEYKEAEYQHISKKICL